jgi:adenosylcobinamide amidohydrolase
MIGDAVLYAASRATSSAIDHVARRAKWIAVGGVFLVCALVVALVAAFWMTAPIIGAVNAAAIIASGCLVAGIACMVMPFAIEKIESWRKRRVSPGTAAVAVVKEEAHEAVDYFGAMQVVGAAFLFGLGTARRLKRR